MAATFLQQFKAIFKKNIRVHIRSRSLIKELINLAIMIGVVIVLNNTGDATTEQQIPFYMSIAIMLFTRGVAMTWVSEKQSRQSEVQKIMGASNLSYYTAWMVFYIINGFLLSLIFIGALTAAGVFSGPNISFGSILGLYFLYLVCSFSFVLFLTTFFSDALLASQIVTFVQLLGSMLYFLLLIQNFRSSQIAMQVTAILPSVCFQYTALTLGLPSTYITPWTQSEGFITLGVQAIVYFVLFIYLSLVLPNENGSHKHPLFFIKDFFEKKHVSQLEESIELVNLSSARYYQEIKQYKKISMYLKDLTKSFDDKVIVNKLSLSLFEGEVYCLLGHNGAGKTTTINMLTGILQPDSGLINIFGYDYYQQMSQIRHKTGVCLQIDVLYDDLTVKDHLQFYAHIKGIPLNLIETKVNQIIGKCSLAGEQDKRIKELSGGNKRKTCLACASIGNSQLLFLDEPSSGLDPGSRKVIWGLIDELRKEGRTLILTTHHLEEAEALANRIGILSHGQMLVQGSCHYIKERFGCGYYLQIALNQEKGLEEQRGQIKSKVKELITNFREDEQVNEFSMRFLLPNNQQEHYSTLFTFLEKQGIKFSLKLSSLQDIFIKIGLDALSNDPLPELQKVVIPQYEPVYNWWNQFKHIFQKKFKTTVRSASVFTSIMLPIIFIVVGVVIAMESYTPPLSGGDIWGQYYTIAYFMSLAFAFNTASYCGSIVKQRQIKFKYLSYVMGMKKASYWLGTIAFDMIMFCVPFSIIFLVIGCFPPSQSSQFVSSFGWLALSLILFSFSFLPFTYLWSFAFDNSRTAYRFYPFIAYILFYVLPSIPIYTIPTSQAIQYILPIVSPLIGLTQCMLSQQMLGTSTYVLISNDSLFVVPQIWYPLMILGLQGVVFFTLVLVFDNLKFKLNDRQLLNNQEKALQQSEDLKKQKVKISQLVEDTPVVVDGLFKKYPNGFIAIKDNSFLVQKGQTFGLLGPNGAGKSTTFNILTAATPKSSGTVMLHGSEVNRAVDQIFTTVGVCPQFNPLYDQLTTKEHIEFFAGIKGLKGEQQQHITQFYLKNLQLDEYTDMRSKNLSGGNKRKLCVAMSLVGNPSLVFMDEPSAGVDPIARRYLWNILHSSASLKNRSIVLTTHSINEAESLCDRIGILIKGEFFCIDSPMELKRRFGRGYRATLRCPSFQQINIVKDLVKEQFNDYIEQTFIAELKICFEFPKQTFVFSKAFGLFYNNFIKNNLIYQFEISQTTLEEVFIHLSKMQIDRENQQMGEESTLLCCFEKNSSGCFCLC